MIWAALRLPFYLSTFQSITLYFFHCLFSHPLFCIVFTLEIVEGVKTPTKKSRLISLFFLQK